MVEEWKRLQHAIKEGDHERESRQLSPFFVDAANRRLFVVVAWQAFARSRDGNLTRSCLPVDNGLPKESIRNPFIPWLDPVTKHWNPPLYNLHWQRALVKEARRLNMTHLLPSGPKTPLEFANTQARVWTERGRERERVELGTIRWSGVYEKKLNPFGVGRYFRTPAEVEEEKERRKAEKEQLTAEGAAEREWADFEKEVQVFPEEREVGGLPRWGPYA
jgi:hypothetical protein